MIPNPYTGVFIVFEGIDGCGKTKQLELTQKWLCPKWTFASVKEPGKDRPFGARIYQDLRRPNGLHKTDPLGFQTWFACDSKENLQRNINPRLNARCIILADRFRPSMVYGVNNTGDLEKLMTMNKQIIGEDFIWPDIIFIFDVFAETAIKRLKEKGRDLDEFEQRKFLERVRVNYLLFARIYPNCHIINAEGPPEKVFEEVKKIFLPILESKPGPVV